MTSVTANAQTPVPNGSSQGRSVASLGNHRQRILKAALALLTKHGRDAVTTRAVAVAARVQPPVLYRLFQDKTGLLHALAEYGFETYLDKKRIPEPNEDPVESLRIGWKLHIDFALNHPELYLLMYSDPDPDWESPAAQRSHRMLMEGMRRVALTGRLRVSEQRAAYLFHAAAFGIAMTILAMPAHVRDMSLSATACEIALSAIVTDRPEMPVLDIASAAVALNSFLGEASSSPEALPLTEAERRLLSEWLNRLSEASIPSPSSSDEKASQPATPS